jgi:formylglycine-generating enzyme required for sulfatase activity
MKKKKAYFYTFLFFALFLPIIFGNFQVQNLKTFTNSVGVEFVRIPAGQFQMGMLEDEEQSCMNNVPKHKVIIDHPFYISKYEVTQKQWRRVMGTNPSKFKGDTNPVERISWTDAQKFLKKLNRMENTHSYRLPTEAEWEYVSRANTVNRYFFGKSPDDLNQYAWSYKNSGCKTHPVGLLKPNPWGLYDILGNVWEWCQDTYRSDYYQYTPVKNPPGPKPGSCKVLRGGSWHTISSQRMSCCYRFYYNFNGCLCNVGFRLVRDK